MVLFRTFETVRICASYLMLVVELDGDSQNTYEIIE